MGLTHQVAEFITGTSYEDFPPKAIFAARHGIIEGGCPHCHDRWQRRDDLAAHGHARQRRDRPRCAYGSSVGADVMGTGATQRGSGGGGR